MSGVVPSRDAWDAIREMYRWWRSYRTQGAQNGQMGQSDRRVSRHPLRMAITTEEITPDTYGGFKFASGAKGSEVVTGEEYQGFYRASTDTDPPDLPADTLCFAIWVPCDTLGETETGWELTPVQCVE